MNLSQFLISPLRIGQTMQYPWRGDVFTAQDGTVWKCHNNRPLAYSSDYATLLAECPFLFQSGATSINGPNSGSWIHSGVNLIMGTIAGTLLAMRSYTGSVFADDYYTSTDGGANWTKRTLPYPTRQWTWFFDGTNFIGYSTNNSTNGVIESTDGITWTGRTAVSMNGGSDFVYNGSVYVVINVGTIIITSPDRATWTQRAVTAIGSGVGGGGMGLISWNAGAGLFLLSTSTAGQYQTSPDAITWTNRTTWPSTAATFALSGNVAFASNATTTVAISPLGGVCTSTDGINWTNRELPFNNSDYMILSGLSWGVHWDGTNFIARNNNGFSWYSSNGITWTKTTRMNSTVATSLVRFYGETGFLVNLTSAGKIYRISNAATTATPDFFLAMGLIPSGAAADAAASQYMRIK